MVVVKEVFHVFIGSTELLSRFLLDPPRAFSNELFDAQKSGARGGVVESGKEVLKNTFFTYIYSVLPQNFFHTSFTLLSHFFHKNAFSM
jgi:hypothetical protein